MYRETCIADFERINHLRIMACDDSYFSVVQAGNL
jgi:hypothetical protein